MKTTRLYRLTDASCIAGSSASDEYKLVREARFSSPLKITPKCSVLTDGQINSWIEEKKAESGVRT